MLSRKGIYSGLQADNETPFLNSTSIHNRAHCSWLAMNASPVILPTKTLPPPTP